MLILTDGAIEDPRQTIDAVVYASNLPMSIIIIGVGNADFSTMELLDGDKHRLMASDGSLAARDIVQFVPFNKYASRGIEELAAEVLRELPKHVTEFYAMVDKKPNPAPEVNMDDLMKRNQEKGMEGVKKDFEHPNIPAPENPVEKLEKVNLIEEGEEGENEDERRERLKTLIKGKFVEGEEGEEGEGEEKFE